MLTRLLDRFRSESLREQVEASIRAGTGLRNGEWLAASGRHELHECVAIAQAVVAWCQDTIAQTRRPYGIDQLALAIACAEPAGRPLASATFGVFRPVDFYADGGIAERVHAFVLGIETAAVAGPVRFAAALFSWGDGARETIYRDAPPA